MTQISEKERELLERDLLERQRALEQRAIEIRLRELDAEINAQNLPIHPTIKHKDGQQSSRSLKRDLIRVAQFSGLFVGGVVVVYVSQWLAWISAFAIVAAAGWTWFKLRK